MKLLWMFLFTAMACAQDDGFRPLFDGKSLNGWRGQDMSFWSVEDGAITGTNTPAHAPAMNQYLVWTGGPVTDFELKLKFRLTGSTTPNTNGGFQFRSRVLPNGDVAGYQVDNNFGQPWRARLYDEHGRHDLALEGERTVFEADGTRRVEKLGEERADFRLDEWHEYHLVARGPRLSLRVNGRLIAETTDGDPQSSEPSGVLALQLHTGPPMKAQFKEIVLKPLSAEAGGERLSEAMISRRDDLASAALHWRFGERAGAHQPPLKAVGTITVEGGKVARFDNAYFDTDTALNSCRSWNVQGEGLTVYLRARVPDGRWTQALFAKRGHHDLVNWNLFSVDLGGTPGPDIGFEIHTDRGFFMVSFPVSKVDATAWHDLVGRYDGQTIQILCDGKVMAERPAEGALTANNEPVLIGAETEQGKPVRFFTGEMEEAAVWPFALSDERLAALCRVAKIEAPPKPKRFASPIHFRPRIGRFADPIPFFDAQPVAGRVLEGRGGEYHMFYLRGDVGKVPWDHLVSTDLVRWRELPPALISDGAPDSTDGEHMFTGSVVAHDGVRHIFYTGFNPRHPRNREHICHATSPDGLKWTKHPEHTFTADGVHYDASRENDFRDPFVFWNEAEQQWWMLLCARTAGDRRPVTGVAVSRDLVKWEQRPSLCDGYRGTPECPDLFRLGATWYLIVSPSEGMTTYRSAPSLSGPWSPAPGTPIDTPILYAAKRMFDGRRHVLTGWQRDLGGDKDGGPHQWGGTQSLPREVYEIAPGELGFRPVQEVRGPFSREAFTLAKPLKLEVARVGAESGRQIALPDDYHLQARLVLEKAKSFTVGFRVQGVNGYRLTLHPQTQEIVFAGQGMDFRRKCIFDAAQPVQIEAFVVGNLIECFINDRHAFSARAYDFPSGGLELSVTDGAVEIRALSVRTP